MINLWWRLAVGSLVGRSARQPVECKKKLYVQYWMCFLWVSSLHSEGRSTSAASKNGSKRLWSWYRAGAFPACSSQMNSGVAGPVDTFFARRIFGSNCGRWKQMLPITRRKRPLFDVWRCASYPSLIGVACRHMLVLLAVLSQHMPLIWTSWRRSFGCNSGRRNNIVLNMRQLRRLLDLFCSFQGNVEGLAAWHMLFGHEFFVLFHAQLGVTLYYMIKLQSESKLMKVEWQNVASRFRKICVRSCEKLKPTPLRRSKLPRRSLKVCEVSFSCEQKVSSCQDKFHAVEFDYNYMDIMCFHV